LNRGAPSVANTGTTDPPASKKKKAEKHTYPTVTIPLCDDLTYTRNLKVIEDELTIKTRPSYEKVADAMQQTYPNRRQTVLSSSEKSVDKLCREFPLLKSPKHVRHKLSTLWHTLYYVQFFIIHS